MKPTIKCDRDANAAYIKLSTNLVVESDSSLGMHIVCDFDAGDSIVGIEILEFYSTYFEDYADFFSILQFFVGEEQLEAIKELIKEEISSYGLL